MAEMIDRIGEVNIGEGEYIPTKIPEDFEGFRYSGNDNLLFDEDYKWTLENGETLPEGESYAYGEDISVQANWLKKVKTIVWSLDSPSQTINDLIPDFVHVNGGTIEESDNEGVYAFFRPDGTATLSVVCDANNTITTNGHSYKFLGWSSRQPGNTISNQPNNLFDNGRNPSYNIYPIEFSSDFSKKEWAIFLYGSTAEIIVTTNIPSLNNNPDVTFSCDLGTNSYQAQPFYDQSSATRPIDVTNYIGGTFKCAVSLETYNGYKFAGWYIGEWTSQSEGPSEYLTLNATTPLLYILRQQITLTAVYLPATTTYTITYYSGLPAPE